MANRKYLVVLRCGDQSLHPNWVSGPRGFDLAVSYFGGDAERPFPEAAFVHRYKGGKWDGLADFFRSFPELLGQYDYFWLPDDDILTDAAAIDRLFAAVAAARLELAQPSLTPESYLSHLLTLTNPAFDYRLVNFVELMAPVLSPRLLAKVLPLFGCSRSGFGIDYVWQRFTAAPERDVAIIDSVAVTHTRAVGGALHRMIRDAGHLSPQQEEELFLAPYGAINRTRVTFGGKLRHGLFIRGRHLASTIEMLGWAARPFGRRGFTEQIGATRFLRWVIRHWIGALRNAPQIDAIEPIQIPLPAPSAR